VIGKTLVEMDPEILVIVRLREEFDPSMTFTMPGGFAGFTPTLHATMSGAPPVPGVPTPVSSTSNPGCMSEPRPRLSLLSTRLSPVVPGAGISNVAPAIIEKGNVNPAAAALAITLVRATLSQVFKVSNELIGF
ncbi:MAG TPA: hypothetical protein VN877_02335, partial [Opitutaceae bacterium]|nr:hypothetical protein [Opitutaceae bacterium]